MKNIKIKGAYLHNLKRINISIPKNKLVVATGISGSGKSSLVFDIVFEEGRRQYLQSLGMFPGIDEENNFDSIEGIGPTIAVKQNIIRQSNPRSTVGSRTNILNIIGLLYSSEGSIVCSSCGIPVNDYLTCEKCGNIEERLGVTSFSYNSPDGMCIKCAGRGAYFKINMDKLLSNNDITLQQIYSKFGVTPGYTNLLRKKYKDYMDMPFIQIPDEIKEDIIYGQYVENNNAKRSYCLTRIFENHYRNGINLEGIYTMSKCSECEGFMVGEEARRVLLNGKHIGEIGKMSISKVNEFFKDLIEQKKFSTFGEKIIKEILKKTAQLINIKLGHLSLYRKMSTLSGGEIQRLFLNFHLESKMDSIIYILDEPTAGLHESEKGEFLKYIYDLKELGNTVIVVEHDRNTIEMAEHIIDIGPKAGIDGGKVVYQGDFEGLLQCNDSITGQYLSEKVPMPKRSINKNSLINKLKNNNDVIDKILPCLLIKHAKTNNLKDVKVTFPLGIIVGIAGVSGSGKSSLVSETLIPCLKEYFNNGTQYKNEFKEIAIDNSNELDAVETIADKLEGVEHISGYVEVSQEPIGRNISSNPVSYIGVWDKIRRLFEKQSESIEKNLSMGYFSFNSKGACSKCNGIGRVKIWLGSSLNIFNTCKECSGKRFNDEALSVSYKGKNIYEILEMSVSEAVSFFDDYKGIVSTLKVLERIGMGYIKLGQPTPTLSGGELQRIKLAKEIGRRRKGNILYILDEPTTGLSLYDTAKLIILLDELVIKGNSVIIIEHDPVVLKLCDWIIELGPGGGDQGGMIISEGLPEVLRKNSKSIIGRYL